MEPFDKIFCILKRSELDHHLSDQTKALRMARLSKAKQTAIKESAENQKAFIEKLRQLALGFGLDIQFFGEDQMESLHPGPNDLVMTCGGDGTFLACAKHFDQASLLGLNSDYKPKEGLGSYGALTSTNRLNLEERLTDLVEGRYRIDRWNRLQVEVNGELIPRYAVNDIYYGQRLAYRTCDLHIQQGVLSEDFSCSGLLCCTGMGSHAWHYNAGGSPFSNELEAFGFRVLFPNLKRPLKFSSGIIGKQHRLNVTPERDDYILSFDSSLEVINTQMGDDILISLAQDKALRVVAFAEPI
ncbi:MAG: hypothetical protein RRB13_09125 [bacterium]|nr:hypothetical protein [bacterium]